MVGLGVLNLKAHEIFYMKQVLQDVLTNKECCEALTEEQMDRLTANIFS